MFHGSIVALVTPFKNDEVDLSKLKELVEWHIQEGTHAIVAAGTTGESGTLNSEEKLAVIRAVVEQANDRVPVIAGTASNATRDCITLTREAMGLGAHAALIMTPAYIKPTQHGLYAHYQAIAEAVPMPIILYNVPGRTRVDLMPQTVIQLSKISNIIGIKDATADIERLEALLVGAKGQIDIFSGDDETSAAWMLSGAKGVISVSANVAPRLMARMSEFALQNDANRCLEIDEQLRPLHQNLFIESNPIPAKWALAQMGLINGDLRMPLTSLSDEAQLKLSPVLGQLKLI